MQVPQESQATKLYIKQYTTHTMTKLHAEHGPNMILARSRQDRTGSQDRKQDPQMWDLPVDFYIVVHIPEVPHPLNEDQN